VYTHRGLMVDTGRRFVPIDTLKKIVDGLSYSKMSVLHLHLSDEPGARLESSVFPELTAHLPEAAKYTQTDMKAFVQYAKQRGIRVVPELDMPAHAGGLRPLMSLGLQYCAPGYLLSNDDTSKEIMKKLFSDWAAVFEDDIFHFGADEACKHDVCPGNCTQAMVHDMQKMAQDYLKSIGKKPLGWSDVFTDPTGEAPNAAEPGTVIQNWYLGPPHQKDGSVSRYVEKNFHVIQSRYDENYLNNECCHVGNFPDGKLNKLCFYEDPMRGADPRYISLVDGGEVAHWCDSYCPSPHCTINATYGWMYDPSQDKVFEESYMRMTFPRTTAAAAAYWKYDSTLVGSDARPTAQFTAALNAQTNRIISRGVTSCTPDCACTPDTSCVGHPDKFYNAGQATPRAVTVKLTNECDGNVQIKQREPCSATTGTALAVLKKNESVTIQHEDWIAEATIDGKACIGDPLSTWVGDGTWQDEKYDFRLRCPSGGYLFYCTPDATDAACK